ncbi:protein O-glucosyltransferase 2-like [Culicoides brevitarsis]|uniref:protein O-glucosyltransferase 2-like n=1 Tax=Culicoides brevitarsis TaxID=469753 RepID=UPI00307C1B8E
MFLLIFLFLPIVYGNIPYKFEISGPGLSPNIVLPARYFFIKPLDKHGNLINEKLPGKLEVKIKGSGGTHGNCRHGVNTIPRDDGVIIARYKLIDECVNMKIEVLYDGQYIGNSPYNFKNRITVPEKCFCPMESTIKWMNNAKCPHKEMQIKNDLMPFQSVNFTHLKPKLLEKFSNPESNSLCNYVVKLNKIYRKCYGKYTGFSMFMDATLLSLSRLMTLPDVEFFVNLGDWPLVKKGGHSRTIIFPIFSWCGSDDTFDIVMPTYDITEASLENMGRVSLDMLSVQKRKYEWNEKQNKAFWRGRDARRERLDLIDIGKKYPELFNVSLTNFFFFRDDDSMQKYGPTQPHISFFDFFEYKYQINIDGTVAAYRFPYLLAGDAVVFKQDSPYYEHFYKKLTPMEHYIPIKRDLSDLVEKLEFARENDDVVKEIGRQGRAFAEKNLLPLNIFCYYTLLLQEFSKRIVSPISVASDMELVAQPESSQCKCPKKSQHDEL